MVENEFSVQLKLQVEQKHLMVSKLIYLVFMLKREKFV